MKNVLRFIGLLAIVASLVNVVLLATDGYHSNIVNIGAFVFVSILGFVLCIFAENMKATLSDKQISDAMTHSERRYLREKMERWSRELDEEEIEKLSRGRY
jgi:Mg2+/Co2+ transporter CorB